MPEAWHEFTGRELSPALGISAGEAEEMLGVSRELEVSLPGTRSAFRSGVLNLTKVRIIASAAAVLDPAEARAAEAMVLDRAGSLTPGALRAAIQHAVFLVAPEKARKRREHAAKQARVERWAEPSGNAGLAGRELPPAEVLAADQRVTWWARQLKKAGLEGSMDQLRARAFLDILLGVDSRPQPASSHSERGTNGDPPARTQPVSRRSSASQPAERSDPARVRRAGQPDDPARHHARPGRTARRAGRHRAGRPDPGPGSGSSRGAQQPLNLVRDGHRQPGPRHRARLRPARPVRRPRAPLQTGQADREGRSAPAPLLPHRTGRTAGRVRYLAPVDRHPGTTGPDRCDRVTLNDRLRPPARGQRP